MIKKNTFYDKNGKIYHFYQFLACLIMRNIFIIISGVEVMGYLLEIMQEKNISLQYLSSRLNVSVQLLKYWIDKDYSIRVNQAIQLSSTLDVSINRLFLGTEKPSLNISKLNFEQIQIIYDILDPNHRKQKRHTPNKALEDIKDMGDKIKFIRKDILNLSQNKLAKSFNVSRETVKYWDSGMYLTSRDKIRDISILSKISMDYILIENHPLEISTYEMDEKIYNVINQLIDIFAGENNEAK